MKMSTKSFFNIRKNRLSLRTQAALYLEDCKVKAFSNDTLEIRRFILKYFIQYLESKGFSQITEVSREIIDNYREYLLDREKNKFGKIERITGNTYVKAVRRFFNWLYKNRLLLINPTAHLEINDPETLPKDVLTPYEVERILAVIPIKRRIGLRDRAIVETFYSTGIRRNELVCLELNDLDEISGILRVRQGKGGKQRLVPIGERAIFWINRYIKEVRRSMEKEPSNLLFINLQGGKQHRSDLSNRIRKYIVKAGVNKRGSCHLFRHTIATTMLKNGADIRIIQEILGHSLITTTQIYTHLDIDHLKAALQAFHPAENPDLF